MPDISSITGQYQGGNEMFNAPAGQEGEVTQAEFLQLLITQLQHQDPMQPSDSQEFAAQLAQFTSLEELQNITSTLQQGVEADLMMTQTINNTMAATMIGKELKSFGNTFDYVQGQPVDLHFRLSGYAGDVSVNVRDEVGNVVATLEGHGLDGGDHALSWDGVSKDGVNMPAGTYTFEVTASLDDAEVPVEAMQVGLIEAVRYGTAGAIFIVNGEEISFAEVLELGLPSGVGG